MKRLVCGHCNVHWNSNGITLYFLYTFSYLIPSSSFIHICVLIAFISPSYSSSPLFLAPPSRVQVSAHVSHTSRRQHRGLTTRVYGSSGFGSGANGVMHFTLSCCVKKEIGIVPETLWFGGKNWDDWQCPNHELEGLIRSMFETNRWIDAGPSPVPNWGHGITDRIFFNSAFFSPPPFPACRVLQRSLESWGGGGVVGAFSFRSLGHVLWNEPHLFPLSRTFSVSVSLSLSLTPLFF